MNQLTPSYSVSLPSNKFLRSNLFIFFITCFLGITLTAQEGNSLVGNWQLKKVSFKKITASASNDKKELLAVFKAALYQDLTTEQRLTIEELELMNAEAELLLGKYYQSTIGFKSNGSFYNTSQLQDKSLSGEYLLDKKKLLLEWETADKNELKVLKITADELVFKDSELKLTYYYLKPNN